MTTDSPSREVTGQHGAPHSIPPLRRGFLPALGFANFSIWVAFFTPVVLTLPMKVERLAPDNKAGALSVVLLFSSIFGLVTNPLAGRLSDRTTSTWGMRRPWLLGGVLVGFLGLVVMAVSTNLPLLIVGSCLGQVGFAICVTVLLSLLPEQVPSASRGKVGAVLGVSQAVSILVGVVIGGALSRTPPLAFIVPGLIGFVGIGLLCSMLHDRVLATADRQPLTVIGIASAYWRNPQQFPDFGWAWLSRFLLFMGFAGVINYQVFYLTDQLGIPKADTARYVGMALGLQVVMVVLSSAVSGWLSDRVGRRKPFIFGAAALAALALCIIGFATAVPVYLVGMTIGGIAQGTYLAVDLALIAEILPDKDRDNAKDFGIMALANQLPQTVSPAVAPLFLAIGFGSVVAGSGSNYTAFFLGSAVLSAISALAITRVRGVL